ncbi:MAG: Gfo/Idh/MocA family oxidoreductase [Chloroflexota bacterium]|nr:Gfo/Idh/MocA family oxidoreductase [Chloroflexota bacterium]
MAEENLRFAVIGAGNIGHVHAQAIAAIPGARLTVVGSTNPARGQALATANDALWIPDYLEAAVHPDADVVCICTPTGAHAEQAVAAAEAGKHLVIEKPLDVTLERVDQILAAARAAGVKTTCIFPYRCMAGSQEAKKAVEAGRLGRLTMADARVKWYRTQEYYDMGGWRGTWELDGGGALMNQSIHAIDLMQWLAGPVNSVFGRVNTLAHRMETEDTGAAVLMLDSGGMATIQGATSCWPGLPAMVALHGDRGTIVLHEGRIVTWKLSDAAPGEEEAMLNLEGSQGSGAGDPTGIGFELHRRQLADMVQAIQEDHLPMIDGAEGRASIEIILAVYESARTGLEIQLVDR